MMRSTDLISYQTIVAAQKGDPDAMREILQHYAPYIKHFSQRHYHDDYGNTITLIDDDIQQQIEMKLMYEIVFHFNCTSLPEGETLEL